MRDTRALDLWRIVALAGVAWLSAAAASAGPSPHMRFDFGMVGVARGQTARLNVVFIPPDNPDRGRSQTSDPEWLVELSFADANGQPVGRTVQRRLVPGQSAFVDLSFGDVAPDSPDIPPDIGDIPPDGGDIPPDGPDRVQIRAVVRAQAPDGPDRSRAVLGGVDAPPLLPTLEVMDAQTGRTQAILSPGSTRFFKEVDPAPQRQ